MITGKFRRSYLNKAEFSEVVVKENNFLQTKTNSSNKSSIYVTTRNRNPQNKYSFQEFQGYENPSLKFVADF